MRRDPLPASIEYHIAELRARWPQHQTLISGPPRWSAERAVEAGFEHAAHRLGEIDA